MLEPELLGGSGGSSRSGSGVSRGSGRSGSGVSGGGSRSGDFNSRGNRLFFFAASGQTKGQEGGEQDGVFHVNFPRKKLTESNRNQPNTGVLIDAADSSKTLDLI